MLIHARTLYYLAKALSQHYPSPTLYGDHSFDVSPKNTEAFAAQDHLQSEIYYPAIDIIVYHKINTYQLRGP